MSPERLGPQHRPDRFIEHLATHRRRGAHVRRGAAEVTVRIVTPGDRHSGGTEHTSDESKHRIHRVKGMRYQYIESRLIIGIFKTTSLVVFRQWMKMISLISSDRIAGRHHANNRFDVNMLTFDFCIL